MKLLLKSGMESERSVFGALAGVQIRGAEFCHKDVAQLLNSSDDQIRMFLEMLVMRFPPSEIDPMTIVHPRGHSKSVLTSHPMGSKCFTVDEASCKLRSVMGSWLANCNCKGPADCRESSLPNSLKHTQLGRSARTGKGELTPNKERKQMKEGYISVEDFNKDMGDK